MKSRFNPNQKRRMMELAGLLKESEEPEYRIDSEGYLVKKGLDGQYRRVTQDQWDRQHGGKFWTKSNQEEYDTAECSEEVRNLGTKLDWDGEKALLLTHDYDVSDPGELDALADDQEWWSDQLQNAGIAPGKYWAVDQDEADESEVDGFGRFCKDISKGSCETYAGQGGYMQACFYYIPDKLLA